MNDRTIAALCIVARKTDGEVVPPRTKKNSAQIIPNARRKNGSPMVLLVPSEAYKIWHRAAVRVLRERHVIERIRVPEQKDSYRWTGGEAIDRPVNCRALFYRDRNVGDANGFYQGIADFLEDVGVLKNDVWIRSWDGSRLLKDPQNPRVEVYLEELDEPAGPLFEEWEGPSAE